MNRSAGYVMDFASARAKLIESLSREIKDHKVLALMSHIPREFFVPEGSREMAYVDAPLSIGYGQTISQPFITAFMTQSLELTGSERVLEVGTGSGYQAALLAGLAKRVISTERISELAESARRLLDKLGYSTVEVHLAGETLGYPEEAPYDSIMVTAASPVIPPDLVAQLAEGGRMIIPVGTQDYQELKKVVKRGGQVKVSDLGGCRFVCLIGKGAWQEERGF